MDVLGSSTTCDAETVILLFLHLLNGDRGDQVAVCRDRSSGGGGDPHRRRYCSGGSSPSTAQLQRVAQTFFILHTIMTTLRSNSTAETWEGHRASTCTERDLYYRNTALFGAQGQKATHYSINRLCLWMNVGRWWRQQQSAPFSNHRNPAHASLVFWFPYKVCRDITATSQGSGDSSTAATSQPSYTRERLGITAASKSMVAGHAYMELTSPTQSISLLSYGAVGLPLVFSMASRLVSFRAAPTPSPAGARPSVLLVIEKEAIFRRLLDAAQVLQNSHCAYILLCTKGYPCVASRAWLHRAHQLWPSLPMAALVDGDPHGLCIAMTAMGLLGTHHPHGGTKRRRGQSTEEKEEAPTTTPPLVLPLHLLGARPSLFIGSTLAHPCCPCEAIPLSPNDRAVLARCTSVLRRALSHPPIDATTYNTMQNLLTEALWMQQAGLKCELQSWWSRGLLQLIEEGTPQLWGSGT